MAKILIVEDELKLLQIMKEYLVKYGYEVTSIVNFKNVESESLATKPDLILLDIHLPYFDGFYLCRALRTKLTVPIIIVSSRSSDLEQIMGIELGADDYIVKPFNLEILLTKIKAVLRRAYGAYATTPSQIGRNGLLLNPNNFKMSYQDKEIELSKNEFKLIKKLLEKVNGVVTREVLLMELWDEATFVEDNTLTVNITRLKSKLDELGFHQAIKTIRGVGYLLDLPEEEGV